LCFFKTFFDANTAREFLLNNANFKDTEKNNFNVRWYKLEDESCLSTDLKSKISRYMNKYFEMRNNMNKNMMGYNSGGQYAYYPSNYQSEYSNQNSTNNMNNSNMKSKPQETQPVYNVSLRKESDNSLNEEGKNSFFFNGKYTCRFEIQIENDKEFQVARRLIGAKGCNMKKIVDVCSKNQDGTNVYDAVKLRLRGKGSGYKEGPFNKESDEPLHLCVSSKFMEKYNTACNLVQELINNVFEEYKKYCEKCGKIGVQFLAIRREEGMSTRKNNNSNNAKYNENDNNTLIKNN